MTTADPLAERLEGLQLRAERIQSWLWDCWQLWDSDTYRRVESELRQVTTELAALRRQLEPKPE